MVKILLLFISVYAFACDCASDTNNSLKIGFSKVSNSAFDKETLLVDGKFKLDDVYIKLKDNYSKVDEKSYNNYYISIMKKNDFMYSKISHEHSDTYEINYQNKIGIGMLQKISLDDFTVKFREGIQYLWKEYDYKNDYDKEYFNFKLSTKVSYNLTKQVNISVVGDLSQQFDNSKNYEYNTKTTLDFKINKELSFQNYYKTEFVNLTIKQKKESTIGSAFVYKY